MQESNTTNIGAVNHPPETEWMAYLYEEIAPERKRELHAHLNQCSACRQQVDRWRAGMVALDEWQLPPVHHAARQWRPGAAILKWAAAAVVLLTAGFAIGRQNSHGEVAALKASVRELAGKMENDRMLSANNALAAANEEVARQLTDYAKLNDAQRVDDRQKVALALREFELRLFKLRTELETVAVNTETSFEHTRDGLSQLASIAAADHGESDLRGNEKTINQPEP